MDARTMREIFLDFSGAIVLYLRYDFRGIGNRSELRTNLIVGKSSRNSFLRAHMVFVPVTPYRNVETIRERGHACGTDAMKALRRLVISGFLLGPALELTACVHRQVRYFKTALAGRFIDVGRNASSVIGYGNRLISMQANLNEVCVWLTVCPGVCRLVRRVTERFDEKMESASRERFI